MIVKLKVINYSELKEDFPGEKDCGYKIKFSSNKIYKDLMDEITKNFKKGNIEIGYLIDYDTTKDKHCIFHLQGVKRFDDTIKVTYLYTGTVR
jgi:hypothetical protein